MIDDRKISEEIKELQTLSTVTRAYAEIASLRMRSIREFVLKNREFLGDIDKIFRQVLTSYQKEIEKLITETKGGEKLTFLAHNGKTVSVLLSANTGLYGDIVSKTFTKYLDETKNENVEITIVGKLGAALFEQARPRTPFTYFDFPDYLVDNNALSKIVSHIVQYEEIKVYFGKFQSVVTQNPDVFSISAITKNTLISGEVAKQTDKYLFEPTLEDVLRFFEQEIFVSLFDQTMRESQLAKFASRIGAMSRATENISQGITSAKFKYLKVKHALANQKQLNSLAGILSK